MSTDMLTAKDMQTLLQVDRSTIYRMAEAGRIPAIKVGKQWRFPVEQVDNWLGKQSMSTTPSVESQPNVNQEDLASLLPLECVQLILDTFADALGVMLVVTDMKGVPIAEVSHPCGLFTVVNHIPNAIQKCSEGWYKLGQSIELEPKFMPGHLGLLCARGLIRVGTELKGMVIVGGIAPDNWPPNSKQVAEMAAEFGVSPTALTLRLTEVFYKTAEERNQILPFVQRIANIIAHITSERSTFMGKLDAIAALVR